MFEFLGFGRSRKTRAETLKPQAVMESGNAKSSNHKKQREMVRLALNSVLRRHGMASSWIGCEFAALARADAADVMLVQLVVLKWHEGLLRYTPDLQNELLNDMRLSDTSIVPSDFLFVWRVAPDCGYAFGELPGPDYWTAALPVASPDQGATAAPAISAAAAAISTAAPAKPTVKFDLPKSDLDDDDNDHGFAATQIQSR